MPGRNGTDSRRSTRVTLRVSLQIYESGSDKRSLLEESHSVKVSLWGGLIFLKSAVNDGQQLIMVNQSSGETKEARVVHLGPMHLGKRPVGIEFLEPAPGFWGVGFPAVVPRRSPVRPRRVHYYA